MANLKEQQNVFKQGKQLDPRDSSASDFLNGKAVDAKAGVFFGAPPQHDSAQVFLGGIPLHESAKDFLEND
jgi:hypothetical protein